MHEMRGSVLIVDEMHPGIVTGLHKLGFAADYRPDIRRKEILETIGEYTGLIIRSKTDADLELLEKASSLRFIARAGAGTDKIDEDSCAARNIIILNAPEGNQDALAEHAVGMLLALLNHMHTADRQVRNYQWDREKNRGYEIHSKTVGIIGYGHMGGALAKRLSGFSCQVLAYDKYKTAFGDIYCREASMQEIFDQADILSLHVPLTPETRGYYNGRFFSRFSKNIWLLNTARGEILPTKDLLDLLHSGKIKGAALDVLENEKIPALKGEEKIFFDEFAKLDNVLLTPHVGGWTFESYEKINEVLIEKIGRLNII